jgi:hypothetical protein
MSLRLDRSGLDVEFAEELQCFLIAPSIRNGSDIPHLPAE